MKHEDVPKELRDLNQWVSYEKRKNEKGKIEKIPMRADGAGNASTTNPATWSTFQEAVDFYLSDHYHGIGFVFSENDPYCGVDLDGCRDPETGQIEPWAEDILRELNSYSEISQSGRGIHVIVKATLPGKGTKKHLPGTDHEVEIYDRGRFFATTGDRLKEYPAEISNCQESIQELYHLLNPPEKAELLTTPVGQVSPKISDDYLMYLISEAKNANVIKDILAGNYETHMKEKSDKSPSGVDFYLCQLLGFYTQDPDQIVRIIQQSSLWHEHEKWERPDYQQRTITRALATLSDFWGKDKARRTADIIEKSIKPDSNQMEGLLTKYMEAEKGSDAESEALAALMLQIYDLSLAYRRQWKKRLSELENDKAVLRGEFDEEQRRTEKRIKEATRKAAEEAKSKEPKIVPVAFRQFPDGSLAEQVLRDEKVQLAVYKDGEVKYTDSIIDTENNVKYIPYNDELCLKPGSEAVWLPSEPTPYKGIMDLLNEIRTYIHYYLEVDEVLEKLASYYILMSWVYDKFTNLPYLRALGDTGCGKSRLLFVAGRLCYKPCFIAGAVTAAPIYRIIEAYKGTLVIDEADFKDSEAYADIIKILNCGFQRNSPVIRMEKQNEEYEPRSFDVFCPKILATRRRFKDDALENRMFTIIMRQCTRKDIPFNLDEDFSAWALDLRNKLLMFRFLNYGKVKPRLEAVNQNIEPRLNQILIPISSIVPEEESEFHDELSKIAIEYQSEILTERSYRWEAEILAAILKLHDTKTLQSFTMKEIADVVNAERDPGEKQISARRVGSVVKKSLYLKTQQLRNRHGIIWEENKTTIEKLSRLHGLEKS